MKPLTIFKRMVIGNVIILVLILALGSVAAYNLKQLQKINHDLIARHQEAVFTGERLVNAFKLLIRFDEKYFVAMDPDYFERFHKQQSVLSREFDRLSGLLNTEEQKSRLGAADQALKEYLIWFRNSSAAGDASIPPDFKQLTDQRQLFVTPVFGHLETLLGFTREVITQRTRQAGQMTRQTLMITILTTLLTFLAGVVITILNTRSIKRSVQRLQLKTKEIALGRFEEIQTMHGPKEIQDLAAHFNTMCRRLKELDDLKADFINHVSHELRTPMTSIKEAVSMLTKGFYKDQPQKQEQLFQLIQTECQRLLKSVIRILDFSKMEAGKMEYRINRLQMPDLLRQSILRLAPLAQKKNLTMEFSPPDPDLPDIRADKDRMIEVIDNLIGNAIKFTPENGKVCVECGIEKNGGLVTSVMDNGPGIALEHLEMIFYKFKQIDKELNTRMGTGLGLCISKHIIKAHGGEIWAENMDPNGTRVAFTLPV